MSDLKISGHMKIKTLKANFKAEFGSTLRVYSGVKFADDENFITNNQGWFRSQRQRTQKGR